MSKKGNRPPPRPVGKDEDYYDTGSAGGQNQRAEFRFFFGREQARGPIGSAYTRARAQEQARRRAPSSPAATRVCPHSVLGVACDASPQDLRSAYRARAKDTHPDLGPAGQREQRTRLMARLNRAYEAALEGIQ